MPVLLAISLLAMAAWMYLLAWHGGFWRTDQRLPAAGAGDPAAWPDVVAVVPARDDAEMLAHTVPTLLIQWHEDKLTVFRARKIQRFLSQPFHDAEVFTGTTGQYDTSKDRPPAKK